MSSTSDTQPVIDALPYVDTIIDDDDNIRMLAMKEVDDEMEIFPPDKDYLEHLPDLNYRPFLTPLLTAEQLSIERQELREDSSKLSHLPIDIPPITSSTVSEDEMALWEKCLNQIKIKLEYQQRQLINLDILKTYNLEAWKLYMTQNEQIDMSLKKEIDEINKRTQQVNWSRKEAQEQVGKTLDLLTSEWNNLVDKNHILSKEIQRIKSEAI